MAQGVRLAGGKFFRADSNPCRRVRLASVPRRTFGLACIPIAVAVAYAWKRMLANHFSSQSEPDAFTIGEFPCGRKEDEIINQSEPDCIF